VKKSKSMCVGCRDDYYNRNRTEGCWLFKSARIVTAVKVGNREPPPYAKERAAKFLNCYHKEGYSLLSPDDCRVKPKAVIQKESEGATR
jgi:hypothetical protein